MEWIVSKDKVEYETAVATMEKRVANIRMGTESEAVWLVEHPPLYTAGTSAKDADLLNAPFPVYQTGRGGQYTYHGPGQRVAYVMLDLQKRAKGKQADVRRYVFDLEEWIIQSLALLSVRGERRQGRIGIWVDDHGTEKKIAAIGVRVRSGVTYHGIAINVDCDLSHYGGIVPCGISEFGVTSLKDLGVQKNMHDVDVALHEFFPKIFTSEN